MNGSVPAFSRLALACGLMTLASAASAQVNGVGQRPYL